MGVDKKALIKSRGYVSYLRGGDPTRFATRFYLIRVYRIIIMKNK